MGEQASLIRSWIEGFVESALKPQEVDDFVRGVDRAILGAIPELAEDPTLAEDLHASTREQWRSFLVRLSGEHRLALPPAAIALSLSIARRNHDISVLLKVYRVANKTVFRYFIDHTDPALLPAGLARDEALLALWLRAEAWIDESVEQLIDHFTRERASLAAGASARRAETIEALLAGAPPSREAELALGHRLAQWQTAFVLFTQAPATEAGSLFEVALKACRLLGLPAPLTHLAGSRELWGWAASPREVPLRTGEVADLLAGEGMHLALSRPCKGPGAFRTSHLQAEAAHRLGLNATPSVHAYGEHELVCLLGDDELARELVRRTLHPLLDGGRDDIFWRTALAYLRAGQRVDATASAMSVHTNTVRYRLARVEEILGHRIGARAALLEVCLSWLEVHGEEALEPGRVRE